MAHPEFVAGQRGDPTPVRLADGPGRVNGRAHSAPPGDGHASEAGEAGEASSEPLTGAHKAVLIIVDFWAAGRTACVPDGAALLGLLQALDRWTVVATSFDDLELCNDGGQDACLGRFRRHEPPLAEGSGPSPSIPATPLEWATSPYVLLATRQ